MRRASAALLVLLASAALWAWWPQHLATVPGEEHIQSAPAANEVTLASLDADAFRAPLWMAPPAPPAPPPAPAPPPPLKLQLLAVVHEGTAYRAMLYNPDSDKVLVVGAGEKVGARSVEKVTASGVQIRDGGGVRTLALRQDQGDTR